MPKEIEGKLDDIGKVLDALPDFIKGKVVGYAEAIQAMSRDQPDKEQKTS